MKGVESLDDQRLDLVRQAVKRDGDAFIEVTDSIKHRLYRTARTILGIEADAEDALDETMFKAWRGIHSLRHPEFFDTWITTILVRECQKILKRQKRELLYAELPETAVEALDALPIHEAVRCLPQQLRDVIALRFFSEMTVPQTAQALAIPEGTVKTRQRKALSLLKLELGEDYEK